MEQPIVKVGQYWKFSVKDMLGNDDDRNGIYLVKEFVEVNPFYKGTGEKVIGYFKMGIGSLALYVIESGKPSNIDDWIFVKDSKCKICCK